MLKYSAGVPQRRPWGGAVAAALASAVFFGLNAVASKFLFGPNGGFDGTSLFVARGFWSIPLFLLLALAARPRPFPKWSLRDAGLFAFCGLMYGPGTNALSSLGASRTSAAHAVLLLSLFPPLAALLAAWALGEKLSKLRIAGIMIGVLGAAVLSLSKGGDSSSVLGDCLIAAFILTWALLTLGIRRLDSAYPPLFVVGVFGTLGGVMLVAVGIGLGRVDAILIPIRHADATTFIWFDLELVLFLSLIGQLLQSVALRSLNVALVVALTSYGSIAAGMAASVVLLGERLSVPEIVAGCLLVGALMISLTPEASMQRFLARIGVAKA